MNKPRSIWTVPLTGEAALVAMLRLYVGEHVLLAKPGPVLFSGRGPWPHDPRYQFGRELARIAFSPLQKADEKIRPHYWNFTDVDLEQHMGWGPTP